MPVFKRDGSESNGVDVNGVDEFTRQAAHAEQHLADEGAQLEEMQDQPRLGEQPLEDAAEDEVPATRGPLQTREAYLKKGEDLIRSLL